MKRLTDVERLKEELLLARIKSGDTSAFVETYDLFAPKIYRHALFRTSSPETAEDVMSETFIRAWETVRVKAESIRHLKAFIYRVADNLIIDHYRRNSRAALPISDEIEETLASKDDPHVEMDRLLLSDKMAAALAKLRPETRDLLVMRYIDDLPIAHIAQATARKANAVYVALHRALKELKEVCIGTTLEN